MDEQEIKIRDREAELVGLRTECLEKAVELSSILVSIDSAKKERIKLEEEKKEFEAFCDEKRIEFKVSNDQITAGKKILEELKETSTKELNQLKSDSKVALKELSLTNNRVLKARDELKVIELKEEEGIKKVEELTQLVLLLPQIQSEISSLEEKRNSLKTEISEMIDASTLELSKAKEILKNIAIEVEKKTKEANQAEYKCKKYVDELYTHMNDYEILKTRFEEVSGQKYPELDAIT